MVERKKNQIEEASQEEGRRFLPVHDPAFVSAFVERHYDELCKEARRVCWKHQIQDYADDALSITVEKFMCSRIEDRGPRSAIAFAVTILKNTCIDEVRRRGRHAILGGAMTGDLGSDDDDAVRSMYIPEPQAVSNPEADTMNDLELLAVQLGFERLPALMKPSHKNAGRDLQVVRHRYMLGMSWKEIAEALAIDRANRQSAARGRELLRGWVHALCETQPEPEVVNRKYWQRGYEQGLRFRSDSGEWPPRGEAR